MGKCFLSSHSLIRRLLVKTTRGCKKTTGKMGQAIVSSCFTKPNKVSYEISNVVNVSVMSNDVVNVLVTSDVVNVPVKSDVINVSVSSEIVNKLVTNDAVNLPVSSNVGSDAVTNNVVSMPPNTSMINVPVTSSEVTVPNTINVVSAPMTPKNVEDLPHITGYENVNIFTYDELSKATNYFRPEHILGEGGFGLVYKGVIDETIRLGFKSTQVAVKEHNPDGFQGDREWLAEINYLGQFSHPNLVKLIGYCCEDEHRLLVYEYMACGSLERHLFRRRCLTMPWPTRMNIALDAAKGLAFLHGAERPIIYRDFKTSNILLDENYNAKLSDFGLAKEGPMGDQTHVSTRVMGTYGYAAPEYVMTGHLTAMSDVYSFGVVLLEMLIGRRALEKSSRNGQEHNLVEWARPLLIRTTKLLRIIDPRMEGQYSSRTAVKVANLAYRCISENPKGRPTMNEVVQSLKSYIKEERLHRSCAAVAPNAVPKESADGLSKERQKQGSTAKDGDREGVHHDRRRNGRSKSDPPKELDHRHSPSMYSDCQQEEE